MSVLSSPQDVGRASISEIETLVSPVVQRRNDVAKDHNPGSQQLEILNLSGGLDSAGEPNIVDPPITLRLWATQLSRNTRLGRGIRVIARNTVGLGWEIVPIEPLDNDTPKTTRKAAEAEQARVEAFFKGANPNQPLSTILEREVIDEEAIGNGYLEFTRTGGGDLERIYHVMGTTMRILRDGRGYAQVLEGRRKYFKQLGDPRVMDSRDGKFSNEEGFNKNGDGVLPVEVRATEILHFPLYHPMSEFYGLPRYISAGMAIAGNFHAARRNVAFFANDAVPRMAVLVTGGQLSKDSKGELAKTFQEGQGADQAHRVMILETVQEGVGVDDKNTSKLELKPLTLNVAEDGSFLNYQRANNEEIREALGLSEVYFKSEKLTKASAVVAKATTDEQEFEPARLLKEEIINFRVVQQALGASRVKFRFKRPETTDPVEKAKVHSTYSDIGALTPNEVRRELGKDPLPETETWANVPLPIALLATQGQVVSASAFATPDIADDPETQVDDTADAPPDGEDTAAAANDGTVREYDPAGQFVRGEVDEQELDASALAHEAVGKAVDRVRTLPLVLRSRRTQLEETS